MKHSVWLISPMATLLLCGYPAVANLANPPVISFPVASDLLGLQGGNMNNSDASGVDIIVAQAEWQQFTSTSGNYTVLMPTKTPTEKKSFLETKAGRIELQDAMADLQAELYGVSYGDYPDSQATPAKALDDVRSVVLTVIPGKLLKEKNLDLDGYSGKEIEIEGSEGTSSAIIRIYLVQQRLYLVAAATKEKKESFSQGSARFFNSFRLVATKPPSGETKPPTNPPNKPTNGSTSG